MWDVASQTGKGRGAGWPRCTGVSADIVRPMALQFPLTPHPAPATPERRAEIFTNPGFGVHFSDHMALATWTPDEGWHEGKIVPYGPFELHPAAAVLHYGQEIFEGLKAYRHDDDSVWLFRPEANAVRFARSARRLGLPELPVDDFVTACLETVRTDVDWVPADGEQSLYIRPFMFASENFLGVRGARHVTFCVITSPVGAYFSGGVRPVDIWITTEYSRAGRGGTGAAKCGGNYASSLLAQQQAYDQGCSQVLFADAAEQRYLEELGGMNVFLVTADGELHTPELSGSILEGITRDAILELAPELGLTPVERKIGLDEALAAIADGSVTEVFACGTAAVITPIGLFKGDGRETVQVANPMGEKTLALRNHITDVQYGRRDDTHGWMQRVR